MPADGILSALADTMAENGVLEAIFTVDVIIIVVLKFEEIINYITYVLQLF